MQQLLDCPLGAVVAELPLELDVRPAEVRLVQARLLLKGSGPLLIFPLHHVLRHLHQRVHLVGQRALWLPAACVLVLLLSASE